MVNYRQLTAILFYALIGCGGSDEITNYYGPKNKQACYFKPDPYECLTDLAVRNSDPDYCLSIEDKCLSEGCMFRVAITSSSTLTCSKFKERRFQNLCNNFKKRQENDIVLGREDFSCIPE
ncbi:hypothetical protein J4216_05830 [Candidatus Woesearchaeota archaeon]|nr:hypothetical protein [Candidatus Woesearchaeota archaeon]